MANLIRILPTVCLATLCALSPFVAAAASQNVAAEADVAAVGQAIATAFNERDAEAFMRTMNTDAFARTVLGTFDLSKKDAADIAQRLPSALRTNVEAGMRSMEKSNGSAKFLRSGVQGEMAYALVRLDLGDNGVDYIKYYVSRRRAVEDWYAFTAASQLSAQVRFNLAFLLKNDSLLSALFGARSVSQDDLEPFLEIRKHVAEDDYAAAYHSLEKFPEAYRKSRQWALLRVTYGSRAGDDQYRAALRHLAANFGGDSELQLILVDHYFYEQRFDRALDSIGALEGAIGGEDASTVSLRGNLLTTLERYDEAATACRRGMALEPDFASAYWCLVAVALAKNDGKLAVEGLTAYEEAFDARFDPDELAKTEAYQQIARTSEFTSWAKAHEP